jgi:hypothetical protein
MHTYGLAGTRETLLLLLKSSDSPIGTQTHTHAHTHTHWQSSKHDIVILAEDIAAIGKKNHIGLARTHTYAHAHFLYSKGG